MFTTVGEVDLDNQEGMFYCPTPGMKIRSGGAGRGLARGRGMGPIGMSTAVGLGQAQSPVAAYFKWALIIGGGLLAVGALTLWHFKTKLSESVKE